MQSTVSKAKLAYGSRGVRSAEGYYHWLFTPDGLHHPSKFRESAMASARVPSCANIDDVLLAVDLRLREDSYARTACPLSKRVIPVCVENSSTANHPN
jgi:hypothetical protein